MAGADMKYTISADLSNAIKQTAVLTGELNGLGKGALQASGYFVKVPASLNTLSQSLAKTAVEANKLDSSLGKNLKAGANTAGQSLVNLGRIAQDAPFGFIGIQNNINPLIESFGRLKAETGSTGGALKALVGSLSGAAGVGLAVSVVTGLLTVFSKELFGGKEAVAALDIELTTFSATISKTKSDIEAFNKQAEFLQKLGQINLRINVANADQRTTLDLQEQNIAARETYQKLLEKEKILYQNSRDAFAYYVKNAASATQDFVGQFSTIRDVPDDLISGLDKTESALVKAAKSAATTLVDVQNQIKSQSNAIQLIYREQAAVRVEQDRKATEEAIKNAEELIKKILAEYDRIAKALYFPKLKLQLADGSVEDLKKELDTKIGKRTTFNVTIPVSLRADIDELNDNLNGILESTFENLTSKFAEGIGSALAGGENIFGSLFQILGQGLKQLGQALIAYGVSIKAFKQAFKNPAVAVAAGIGLTVLGQLIQSKFQKGFATGGYVSGPGSGRSDSIPARLSNGEYVLQASAVRSLGRGFLDTLNTGNLPQFAMGGPSNNGSSIGGGQNLVLSGETITRGQDLLTVWRRATQTYSRIS